MPYYSRPEQVLDHFNEIFRANRELLGLSYVATQDELLIPEFPALEVSMGALAREDHGTRQFLVTFQATFWLYHANYEATHAERNREDMELSTNVVRFLHLLKNRRLENEEGNYGLITGSGFVREEVPGFAITGDRRVVATRLSWVGASIVRYEDS